ncbi:MAG: DNA polymerase III subunit delta [Cyclobacteriaceae bacterium]
MTFAEIPGLEELKTGLTQAVLKNKMAHAQLFSGIDGGAALPISLAYAQFILCANRTLNDSCGTCPNCIRVQKGIHPDLHYFFPKPSVSKESEFEKKLPEFMKSFRAFIQENPYGLFGEFSMQAGFENKNVLITKEESRRLIKTVSMKSVEGGAKIILIWLPEYFHPAAANAILKVLEEPPANTIYLLATNAYESLLATITSRVLLYSVPPFSDESVEKVLVENGAEPAKARQLAKLSYGSIGEAMQLNADDDHLAYEEFRQWMLECLGNKFGSLVERSEVFGKSGRLAQRTSMQFALNVLREALVSGESELLKRSGAEAEFISKFEKFLSPEAKMKMYEELNKAIIHLDRNANAKMVHFHLSTHFSQLLVR